MSFKDHFSSHATAYAAYRPTYPPDLARWLSAIAPSTHTALDVGCGSGQLSLLLAQHFDRVVATDPSRQQIDNAIRHPKIDYRISPAEKSDLPDASVDLLTAAQAAHWFDLPAFYAEAQRVVTQGGAVALIAYAAMQAKGEIEKIVEQFRLATLRDYWPIERALVENNYRDISTPFAPIAAPDLVIEVEWPLAALTGYLDTWSAVRAMERDIGRGPIEAVAIELTRAWGNPDTPRKICWPLTIVAGRV